MLRFRPKTSNPSASLTALAKGLADELNKPLTGIKEYLQYLPERRNNPEFLDKFQRFVSDEAGKVDVLIQQLLEFSQPAPLQVKSTDIHLLIDDAIHSLESQIAKNKVEVIRSCLKGKTTLLSVDPIQMNQALLNILSSALGDMLCGGKLTIGTSRSLTAFRIIIRNTSWGISKENVPYLFDPFFHKDNKKTGLELAIARTIIEKHGGRVTAESKLSKGMVFIIELPLG